MSQLAVGIFPWGDVIEDFLDPLSLDVHDFARSMSGGWLFGYIRALQAAGHRAVVICPSASVDEPTTLEHGETGAPICLVPRQRGPRASAAGLRSVIGWAGEPVRGFQAALARHGCNRILAQEYEYVRFDRLAGLGHRMGVPVFASFQGGDHPLSRLEAMVRPRTLAAAAGLVVASSSERERLRATYPDLRPPVAAIPNPIDVEAWRASDRADARRRLGLPDGFVAINHGRIDLHRKGHDILLQAWAQGFGDAADARLVVIGSGQDHARFEQALSASGLANVLWVPHYVTDRAEMRRWLSAADVYVSASRIEGMPVAPLEALACSLPVVATDAQGIADILFDGEASGGLVVARDDVAAIAGALRRLSLDPGLRQRMGAAGRRRVETAFSIGAVGEALSAFLGG